MIGFSLTVFLDLKESEERKGKTSHSGKLPSSKTTAGPLKHKQKLYLVGGVLGKTFA